MTELISAGVRAGLKSVLLRTDGMSLGKSPRHPLLWVTLTRHRIEVSGESVERSVFGIQASMLWGEGI